MKNLKQLSFIGILLALILSSCTMQQRVYRSGYNVEWKTAKHTTRTQKTVNNQNKNKVNQNEVAEATQHEKSDTLIDNTASASIDDQQIVLPKTEKIDFYSRILPKSKIEEKQQKQSIKKELKTIWDDGDEHRITSLSAVFSLIFGILGLATLIIAYLASNGFMALILLAMLCGLLALILGVAGMVKIINNKEEYKGLGVAIVGLILGFIVLLISLIVFVGL